MNTNIKGDFQICISVPLIWNMAYEFFRVYLFLLFYLIPQLIAKFLSSLLCETYCIKIQTMSLVLNLFQQRFFVFYLHYMIIRQRLKKKYKLVELSFQSCEWSKKIWFCATTNTAHVQRSYLKVPQLTFTGWRSAFRGKRFFYLRGKTQTKSIRWLFYVKANTSWTDTWQIDCNKLRVIYKSRTI